MFIQNKYTKWYMQLVSTPTTAEYTERHHIVPKCLGGTDDESNLVDLSAKQHFIAHLLLPKMVPGKRDREKLLYALRAMANLRNSKQRYAVGSRTYEIIRTNLANIGMSEEQRAKISESLKGRKLNAEHRTNISTGLQGRCQSEETRAKIKIGNLGLRRSEETKLRISESKKGVPMSDESRRKISESMSGKTLPEEWKRNIAKGQEKFIYTLTSPEGVSFTTKNLKQFCAENGLPYQTFSAQSKKKGKLRSGWVVTRILG